MKKYSGFFILIILLIFTCFILTTCGGGKLISDDKLGGKPAEKAGGSSEPEKKDKEPGKDSSTEGPAAKDKKDELKAPASEETTGDIKPKGRKEAKKRNGGKTNGDSDKTGDSDDRPAAADKSERKKPEGASGLKAGFADDNKQFNYFVDFLNKYTAKHYPINISERIMLRFRDAGNKPLPNASISISSDGGLLVSGKSYADGTFMFFPSEYGTEQTTYEARITSGQSEKSLTIDRSGKREIIVKIDTQRTVMKNIPLDILFIMDTTGSMGEEIQRLKKTIEIINMNIASISTKPKVRFGMVLYKDRGDEYVTSTIPLTGDLDKFQEELDKVQASGGGDYPEDLQSALKDSIQKIKWDPNGIRMAFIITDASPHLDYGQTYTYVNAVKDAQKNAIKFFSVGTGGLNIDGEYVLRQISQYTYAKYIFLTYGERGESEGGKEGSVSHHTGANFQTDKLEAIVIRFAKDELAYVSDEKIEIPDEHFQAVKISDEKNEETLLKLFNMNLSQLSDYSAIGIVDKTPTSVMPVTTADPSLSLNAEYFTEQLVLSINKSGKFKLVERRDIQKVMKELEIGMSGLASEENAAKVGKILGAKMLILGRLYKKQNNYELFLKLVRVETSEVLAVTKARIDMNLGLSKK
jgi:uncharacterized protein YegL